MNQPAIRVEHLSKLYHIGKAQARYHTLRDAIMETVKAPARRVSAALRRLPRDESRADATIWALKDVSFEVERGEAVGIIGRNGAGKSTLLKILTRITEPTEGTADLYGRVGSLLEVGTGFHPELTGRENIYLNGAILGMRRAEIERQFDEIVAFAEVEKFIDTPVKHYSSGMYLRLAFAVAAHLEPEILLVDEVLAVGDLAFQQKCLGKMGEVASQGRTVLFVSHNLEAIISLCSRAFVLDQGRLLFSGESEQAVRRYTQLLRPSDGSTAPHVLYRRAVNEPMGKTCITSVEVLSDDLQPKLDIYTWDEVVLRVGYFAERDYPLGQVILDIRDHKQHRLIVLDSGQKLPLRKGQNWLDCRVLRLPLSAGEYTLGAGITLGRSEWLWRETILARFRVHARDVFEIGRPPTVERMAVAVEHHWQEPSFVAVATQS